MIDLNLLENNEDHEKILQLEGSNTDKYRCIAFIHLGKYDEALKCAEKNSYEAAYIYYKLKRYKKSLRIVNNHIEEKFVILKSQVLYSMGFYNEAYNLLKNFPRDDEIVINLQAMKSMAILTDKVNKHPGHKLYIKKRDQLIEFDKLGDYNFLDVNRKLEFLFNKSFEFAYDETLFVNTLRSFNEPFFTIMLENMLSNQIKNVEGYYDEIDIESLNKTQRDILLYNMKKADVIVHTLHYLRNFNLSFSDNEYKWINYALSENFNIDHHKIPTTSENLLILNLLVGLKNKKHSYEYVRNHLEQIKNEKIKELLSLYITKDDELFNKRLMEISIN